MAKTKKNEETIVEENVEIVEENVVEIADSLEGLVEDAGGEVVAGADAAPEKPAVVKQDIIRGRMPLIIVSLIKFADAGMTDGALATKFRTTNGKVSDIRKSRNFGYIDENFKPNADMKAKAAEFAAQLDDKTVLEAVEATPIGTDEELAAFEATRKASRPGRKAAPVVPAAEGAEGAVAEEPAGEVAGGDVTDGDLAGLTE